jgi:hypothetical protein
VTDHIGLDVIAALDEGLLDPHEAERALLHLRNCSVCAARETALAEVPAALRRAAEAEPPPAPAWVAERLDAALAAEAGSDRTTQAEPDEVPSIADGVRRRRPGRGRGSLARSLAAAAAVCLLGGGGYALFRAAEQPPSAGSAAAAPNRSAASPTRPAPRGGPLIEPGGTVSANRVPQLAHSGTNYQPGQLQAQVESVLRQTMSRSDQATNGPIQQPSNPLPASLQGCVQRVIGAQQPALVDEASYQGKPATVVVVPQPNGPGGQVWVAGAGCSAANGDVLAQSSISSIP